MLDDIPLEVGDIGTITTIAKVADFGLEAIGINSPKELGIIADPIGAILGSFFGGGGLFGGDSDRNINLSPLNVPSILAEAGITIPGAGGGHFDSFRDAAVPLAMQIQAINPAIDSIIQRLDALGQTEASDRLEARRDDSFDPAPPDHAAAIRQNQILTNILAEATYSFQKFEADRKNFLIENPTASNILDLFVKENRTKEQDITNNFFDLFGSSDNTTAQVNLRTLTGRSDEYLNSLIAQNTQTTVTPTQPARPQLPTTTQEVKAPIPPIKIFIQQLPQGQSTLGTSSFPQNPTQPANPQTSANWWANLKSRASTAINVAQKIGSAAQFSFFIRDTFFRAADDLQTLFFGESGETDFQFDFPVSQPPQDTDIFSLLAAQKNIKDQAFGVEELEGDNTFFAQLSPTTKTLLPILLGLITTIIILKKRGVKT